MERLFNTLYWFSFQHCLDVHLKVVCSVSYCFDSYCNSNESTSLALLLIYAIVLSRVTPHFITNMSVLYSFCHFSEALCHQSCHVYSFLSILNKIFCLTTRLCHFLICLISGSCYRVAGYEAWIILIIH